MRVQELLITHLDLRRYTELYSKAKEDLEEFGVFSGDDTMTKCPNRRAVLC